MSHRPGIRNCPRPSITVASRGTAARAPALAMRRSRITTVMPGTEVPAFGSMTVTPVIAIGRGGEGCVAVAATARTRIVRAARMMSPTMVS